MKQKLSELAIFGGSPLFKTPQYVGRPNIGSKAELYGYLDDILERRWLTNNGIYVQKFEEQLANYLGVKHCIAVCNGTVGLELVIRALGLTGEVIVPSFTFIATAHALQWFGITPIFCDIDPATHSIDPQQIESLITDKTSGILAVHLWGNPAPIKQLELIAERYNLKLLFDAAHAFGCRYQGQPIGNFGEAEVFSFHATKFINSLEGGAITTNNDQLAFQICQMKNFGFTGFDEVSYLGVNGKMNEFSAAMGLTNLASIDEFLKVNKENYDAYQELIAPIPDLKLYQYDAQEQCNYQYIVLEVSSKILNRDDILSILHKENILARRYFYPGCHKMAPYREETKYHNIHLPQTEAVAEQVLVLPTGTATKPEDIQAIVELLNFIMKNERALQEQL